MLASTSQEARRDLGISRTNRTASPIVPSYDNRRYVNVVC